MPVVVGWDISNIGTKVSYDNGNNPAFLPTNLRLGTSFMFPLADYHTLAVSLDLNKLLVPTRPRQKDYLDEDGQEDKLAYEKAYRDWQDISPISGIFKSFSDAPGGMKEELREINYSLGAEYSYNQQFLCVRVITTRANTRVTGNTSVSEPDFRLMWCVWMRPTCLPLHRHRPLTRRCVSRCRLTWTAFATCSEAVDKQNCV